MSDDRPVATDALASLGTAPIPAGSGRDAIHLAVEPVIADSRLSAGEWVARRPNGRFGAESMGKALGIVDPFLSTTLNPGDTFWLIIPPRQITSLRHVWSHPAFPESVGNTVVPVDGKEASERWIREYCRDDDRCEVDYFTLMAKATEFCEGNTGWSYECLHFDGFDAHGQIEPEFWRHFEIVTGLKPRGEPPTYFSCSC